MAVKNMENDKKKMTREELVRYAEKMKAYDEELLAGIFENKEIEGGTLAFSYKNVWKGSKFLSWYLTDGVRYQLPRYIVRHLNKGCSMPIYKDLGNGSPASMAVKGNVQTSYNDGRLNAKQQVVENKARFRFIPLDFMEEDLYPSQIALVETRVTGK